jgi:hypothetical protein
MTVLVRGFAQVCVETVITDAHHEVASVGLPFLNLLDVAALGQLALRGASGGALREGRPVRPRDGFDCNFQVGGQDGD